MNSRRQREGSILLSFLLFCGLIVGKYALICAMEIQKIQMVVQILSGFALLTDLMWVYRKLESLQVVNREQCVERAFWFTNKRVQIKIPSILKPVSFESLAGNDFSERCTQAEAHCERNLDCQLWSIDLVTVFDAIFTSRQTCDKLQCLYENLMSSYFRETTVLKKIWIVH